LLSLPISVILTRVPRVADWTRVGQYVRRRREDKGLTQQEATVASDGGVSVATWRNIETATNPPFRRSSLLAVCRVLDWTSDSIDRILRGEEPEDDESGEDYPELAQFPDLQAAMRRIDRQEARIRDLEAIVKRSGSDTSDAS
jgi:transcriptional regulator with XRE-family HTH domain